MFGLFLDGHYDGILPRLGYMAIHPYLGDRSVQSVGQISSSVCPIICRNAVRTGCSPILIVLTFSSRRVLTHFWTLRMPYYFYKVPFFLHFFSLCVHFHYFCKYTLHMRYVFNVILRILLMTDGLNAIWSNDRAASTDTIPQNLELGFPQSVTDTRLDQLVYCP